MLLEAAAGFLFTAVWAVSYTLVIRGRSTVKALLGIFLLYALMFVLTSLRFEGDLLGWFLGITLGFFASLWFVQEYGPEKPTEASVIALFLFAPLVFAGLLLVLLLL